ncbi:MAG: UPF0182 family protein [Candidatus Nanopelagicales bacterium]
MAFNMPGGSGPGAGGAPPRVAEPPSRGRVLVPTILVLSGLILAFVVFATFYSDWLWFGSVDKTSVFSTTVMTQVGLFLVFGTLMAGALALTAALAFRTRPAFGRMTAEQASLERYRASIEPYRVVVTVVLAGLMGVMTGLSASAEWGTFQLWRNGGEFGQTDAQFGLDVGFFVFQLPWLRFVLGWVFAVLFLCLLTAVVVQYLYGGIRLQGDRSVSPPAQSQLAVLAGLILLAKAAAYWLDRYDLAVSSQSLVPGFTGLKYVDVNAVLPSKSILAFAAVVVAILFFITAFRRVWSLPLIALAILLASSILIGWLYPMVVQYFQVRPTEEVRERPYIQNNINATRTAYGLDDVQVQDYDGQVDAPASVLRTASGTLKNIRLLDPSVVSPTFRQQQQIKGFYAFPDSLDIDRYPLPDKQLQGSVVSAREIFLDGLPEGQQNWTNNHTVFTHGYGFVAAKDNTATSDGAPSYFESDIPPQGDLDITEPRIYFGEQSPEYSIVGAPAGDPPRELDFPDDASPTGQKNNTYNGTGGVAVGSWFNRLVYATKFQDSNILLSDLVNSESRIMYDRDPRDRVSKVAPWLTLDGDPYPVVVDGRIKWIVDGYTTSNNYPNSARTLLNEATNDSVTATTRSVAAQSRDQITYIRNSVKATVDAFDGSVNLYLWDDSDPVALAWERVFPDTVQPRSAMPEEVVQHVRYPEDIFKVQRTVLSRYHVTDAQAFYSGQDFWVIPNDPTKDVDVFQPPYYLSLQMPGTAEPSFSLTTAFSPSRRQTLAAFMAANSAPGPDYGTIRVLQLPRNTTIPGPTQVQNNFESDPTVSSQLNLLRRGGQSTVVLGNLLSLPVADGMLYIEPVYVQGAGEQGFPLLQKVLAAYGSEVVMEDNLPDALAKVFTGSTSGGGKGGGEKGLTPSEELTAALADANSAYEEGQRALREGDFTAYGTAQERLKSALDRAVQAQSKLKGDDSTPSPSASPEPSITAPEPTPAPTETAAAAPSASAAAAMSTEG